MTGTVQSSIAGARPKGAAPAHIAELDGFRAAAVLMVLLGHLFFGTLLPPQAYAWMPGPLRAVIGHGWLGVDLFFILSGFLITGILLDARGSTHYFRDFYARRGLRILPLYWACILVFSFAYPKDGAYFGLSLLFLSNFAGAFGVAWPHGPGVFWSLSVEEHFYLLWPLLVRFLTRSWLLAVTLLVVLGTPVLRGVCAWWGMNPEFQIYPWSFFRFDGLALGAIVAIWIRSRYATRKYAWALAAVLANVSVFVTVAGLPFGSMGTQTVGSSAFRYTQAQMFFAACLVLALAYRGTPYTAILRTRFTRLTADYSYCIYLVHLALFDLYYYVLSSRHIDDVTRFGPVGALALRSVAIAAAAFAVAAVSKRWLEDPFLKLKRYFASAPPRAVAAPAPAPAAAATDALASPALHVRS
jgi:peptidoglycan/LPS O-acetylase OafA/YrhL